MQVVRNVMAKKKSYLLYTLYSITLQLYDGLHLRTALLTATTTLTMDSCVSNISRSNIVI